MANAGAFKIDIVSYADVAVMGDDPRTSVVNKYLQSWDVPNLFVLGANVFAHGIGYNPTGLVGGLAYWAAANIRSTYLKDPGPMVRL